MEKQLNLEKFKTYINVGSLVTSEAMNTTGVLLDRVIKKSDADGVYVEVVKILEQDEAKTNPESVLKFLIHKQNDDSTWYHWSNLSASTT